MTANRLLKPLVKKARNVRDIKAIASRCADDPEDFESLVKCLEDPDERLAIMAAWAMGHAVQMHPARLDRRHCETLLRIAGHTAHSSMKRNILRTWQFATLPEDLSLEIADIALRFLGTPKEDIAVKAFSITLLQDCLKYIPELLEEILFILEREMPHSTPAYTTRARKFIKFAARMR